MKIFALGEGSYSVDATKKFIPFNPETDNFRERPASLFIHVNPFLVKTDHDLIVLDTGLGYKNNQDELFIHQHIRNAGFEPEDVSLVLMSHLHYDHSSTFRRKTMTPILSVLLIDDDADTRFIFQKALSYYNVAIKAVEDAGRIGAKSDQE